MAENQITASQIEPIEDPNLTQELSDAQRGLLEAEAELAREQAAVNAFRMHCRLKLDRWIEKLMELQTQKQSLLTQLALLRQAEQYGIPYDEEDRFWNGEDEAGTLDGDALLILPTDVPRDRAAEKRLFRQLARSFHPDLGKTAAEIAFRTEMMAAVNQAYAEGDVQGLYDLADQLDPEQMAKIASISSVEERKSRQQINRLIRRRHKAERRLKLLREENTARLWQKAQSLERDDTHWWELVRLELEKAIEQLSSEIDHLDHQTAVLEAEDQ